MKRRWNANTWVLVILSTIIVLCGVDVGRRLVLGSPSTPEEQVQNTDPLLPEFKEGDVAPDFTLPDSKGQQQSLAKLVKRDTLLCFTCGCEQCRQLQTYLGQLLRILGPKAPDVISVTTADPVAEAAYLRDVKLPHTILYDSKPPVVMEEYKGHPCPRVYGLDGERKVKWIGGSMAQVQLVSPLAMELLDKLNFAPYGSKVKGKPTAPRPDFDQADPLPASAPLGGPGQPAHGPGDGHNHGPGHGH